MVFPSVSIYLDPPNWNQQQSQTQQADPVTNTNNGTTTGLENHAIQLPPVNLAPNIASQSDPFAIAPSSLNRVPHPEPGLKCPRCNCTNTKFCYFNNYSLSQPRHFCRTCRRYWTRGGTLRNVPVGGGSRRNNKRNKSSSSNATAAQTSNNQVPSNIHCVGLSSLGTNIGMGNLGLGFSGVQMQMQMQQQFPFVRELDTNTVAMQMATMNSRFNLNSRNVEGLGGDNGSGGAGNNGGWNIGRSGFDPSSNCSNVFP